MCAALRPDTVFGQLQFIERGIARGQKNVHPPPTTITLGVMVTLWMREIKEEKSKAMGE